MVQISSVFRSGEGSTDGPQPVNRKTNLRFSGKNRRASVALGGVRCTSLFRSGLGSVRRAAGRKGYVYVASAAVGSALGAVPRGSMERTFGKVAIGGHVRRFLHVAGIPAFQCYDGPWAGRDGGAE